MNSKFKPAALAMVFAVLSSSVPMRSSSQSQPSNYPARPAGVTLHKINGTIVNYGRGNHTGSFTVRQANGRQVAILIGANIKIDGKLVYCDIPPQGGIVQSSVICPDWPSNVVVGTTNVSVVYWTSIIGSRTVKFSDEIDSSST